MAKRKNAVKSDLNQLRQALLQAKTAILNFSPEHILAVSYDPSSKATIVKDIPANLESQFTLGEGGGGSAIIVHAVYNETSETWLLDKTNEELYALFEEGKPIFVEREVTYEENGFTCAYKGLGQIINAEYITGEDEGTEIEEWKFYPSSGYNDHFYGYWRGVKSDLPPYWVDD